MTAALDWRADYTHAYAEGYEDGRAAGRAEEREAAAGLVVQVGSLTIDRGGHRALVGGEDVALTPTEWEILALLARNAGRLVTHDEILAGVWGPGYEYRHIVRVNMARLRRRLGVASHLIVTVKARGFRLAGDHRAPVALPLPARVQKPKRWARDWDGCQWCHETTRPHAGRGVCTRCEGRRRRAGKFI
jgi:DNA-binding winged helix-turn-helix (wHTH) protein